MTEAKLNMCFRHRYPRLLEEGRVDSSTVIVDHDEFLSLQSQGRTFNQMAKRWGVTKEDIKTATTLERRFKASEREAAVADLVSESVGEGSSDAPERNGNYQVPEAFGGRYAMLVPPRGASEHHAMFRNQLMRDWFAAKGLGDVADILFGTVLTTHDAPLDAEYRRYGTYALWSRDGIDPSDWERFQCDCDGAGVQVIVLGEVRDLWRGVFPEEDGNQILPKRGRWLEFCWNHARSSQESCISRSRNPTRFADLEDVMECARLGIPLWEVAKAIGVSTTALSSALEDEGFYSQYQDDCRAAAEGKAGLEDDDGPVGSPILDSPTDGSSEPESIAEDQEVSDVISDEDVEVFVAEPRSEPSDVSSNKDGASSTDIVISEPLITESGARSIIATVCGGSEPDENLWTKVEGGWIIRSYRARIAYSGGRTAYCNGTESTVRNMRFLTGSCDVVIDREGLRYREVGRLMVELEDRTCVGVPVVSDYPIMARRWLA